MRKKIFYIALLTSFLSSNVFAENIPATPANLPQNTDPKTIKEPSVKSIDVEKIIKYSSKSSLEFTRRGMFYEENQEYKKALEDYSRALELTPNRSELFIRRADCYVELKDYDKAIKDLTEVLSMRPYRAEIYAKRGKIYVKINKRNLALLDFDKAVELDPLKPDFYVDRGDFYSFYNQNDYAKRDYLAASELYAYMAKNFRAAKSWREAINEYDKAISRNPDNVELRRLRKECADELEAEIKAAEEALKNKDKTKDKKKKLPREELSR